MNAQNQLNFPHTRRSALIGANGRLYFAHEYNRELRRVENLRQAPERTPLEKNL